MDECERGSAERIGFKLGECHPRLEFRSRRLGNGWCCLLINGKRRNSFGEKNSLGLKHSEC